MEKIHVGKITVLPLKFEEIMECNNWDDQERVDALQSRISVDAERNVCNLQGYQQMP